MSDNANVPNAAAVHPLRVGVVTSTYARSQEDHQVPWMREMTKRTAPHLERIAIYAATFRGLPDHEIDGIPVRRFRYAPADKETLTHDSGAPNKTRSLAYKLLVIPYILGGILGVFVACIKDRTNVLHVHWPFPHGLWALLPKWLLGVRVVTMCHGAELALARNSGLVCKIMAFCMRQSDEICANSSHTAAEIRRLTGLSSRIVPYGATVKEVDAVEAPENEIPLLLNCGRLIQRKGIDVLLRAMQLILARRDVRVVITGEGDHKEKWVKMCHEMNLDAYVRFAGFVSNEELADLYKRCDVYVHPAIYDDKGDTEGLGVVLIEALAYNKPVVASEVGGIVDVIVHEKTGLLVPEKNEQALADAILRVLGDAELGQRLGSQGRAYAKKVFDWDRCARMTIDAYAGRDSDPLDVNALEAEKS